MAGLEFVYLVGANSFLNLGLLPLAFESTNQVKASISGGWSVLPGHVHFRNARFVFQDHNLQFSIDMKSGFLVLHLSELARHTVHASHLRGEGVAFRMRHRVEPWSKNEPAVGTFPPIPEFPAPAVFEARVPERPLTDAEYNLWTVHFDDVDASVSEVWVQAFRYQGKGRARGQFQLKPARTLWVGPASLDLEPGLLSAGAYRVAPGLRGHIDCIVHPFDVRPVQGLQPLRYISAKIRLDSPSLDPQVYALFGGEPSPRVSSASGSLHLDAETRHGVLTPQSRLDIVQRGFELRAAQGEIDAEQLELHAGVNGELGSQATLIIDRGTLREPIAPGHSPRIEHLSVSVVSEDRDTAKDFRFKEARLNEAKVLLGDASWLNRWLKSPSFAFSGGALSLLAHGRYKDSLIDAEAVLESAGVDALLGAQRLHYAGGLALNIERADLERFTGKLMADVSGRSLHAQMGKAEGELKLAGFQAHIQGHRDAQGNALQGQAKFWNFSSSSNGVLVRAPGVIAKAHSEQAADGVQRTHFNAEIPALTAEGRGARLTTAAVARGTFAQQKDKPEKSLEVWATLRRPRAVFGSKQSNSAVTAKVDLHAALRTDALGALNGALDLAPAAWVVEARNMRFSGQSALAAKFKALDLARHSGELHANLSSTRVTLGDTTQNADCPWSRVESLQLDGQAKLLARGSTSLSVTGDFQQTELNWGDFLTRGDIGLSAHFDQGLLVSDGDGRLDVKLRNASLQSGAGGGKGWAANVPALEVRALFARKAGKLSGSASLNAPAARGRIGATRLTTDLGADFKVDTLDLEASTMHGSGAVHVRNAALPNVSEPVSKWWADVKLDSLFARAQKNLELGGTFRADLRDATPGLAVLGEQGALPKWVASAFPLRGLSVTGSLARRCRLTDIHLVQMEGGPAVARGRLQSLPDGFQGALLLRVAGFQALSAGLDFDAEHTNFGLFNGDDWLARFNRIFDRKSENAVKLQCPPDPNTCTEPEAVSLVASDGR
ncbi:MAG TPA: hypothetical protein VJV79_20650 [Polyangiaceae bacterium]|nr:hypothetical protein [Polyangiaceae bacterium]